MNAPMMGHFLLEKGKQMLFTVTWVAATILIVAGIVRAIQIKRESR